VDGLSRDVRARLKALLAVVQILPQAPARPLEWRSPAPLRERVCLRPSEIEAELYRPAPPRPGQRHPGVVVSLGANDLGLRDSRVVGLANTLARSGFVPLVVAGSNSLAQTDDLEGPIGLVEAADSVAAAFDWLTQLPEIDATRTGALGVCVGGSICLLAAGRPALAGRIAFVFVIGPYLSLRRLLLATATRSSLSLDGQRRQWSVDPFALERQRAWLLGMLSPVERVVVRTALADGQIPERGLSARALAVLELTRGVESAARAEQLVDALGPEFAAALEAASPEGKLQALRAETFVMHAVSDAHIPVDESRRLASTLRGQVPLHYAEFELFEHAEPSRGVAWLTLARELARLVDHVAGLMRLAV
jgi:dipeptidyl aminopeptidase/acylaminoacyl peptidase